MTLVDGGQQQSLADVDGDVAVRLASANPTDVRQQHWDPALRSDRAPDGRWTVDASAPLDGPVVNGGVRVRF